MCFAALAVPGISLLGVSHACMFPGLAVLSQAFWQKN